MLTIGSHSFKSLAVLAPMAGVTDLPFRNLCRQHGADLVVSEMLTSNKKLWNTRKSKLRMDHTGEKGPISVQIAGGDPEMLAEAAELNIQHGADIIDINMGCPAKKVCKKAAGSALMKDEALVEQILKAVVNKINQPVTLKMRTGWSKSNKNGVTIARMAEDLGIQAIAVHGRTRECKYEGEAEYDTIRAIKATVSIPVIANGDIDSPIKAKQVLDYTGADAVMIGRPALGQPWLLQQIDHFLRTGEQLVAPTTLQTKQLLLDHLDALHAFYGDFMGVKIARKHVSWYLQNKTNSDYFRREFNQLENSDAQKQAIEQFFNGKSNPSQKEEIAA